MKEFKPSTSNAWITVLVCMSNVDDEVFREVPPILEMISSKMQGGSSEFRLSLELSSFVEECCKNDI